MFVKVHSRFAGGRISSLALTNLHVSSCSSGSCRGSATAVDAAPVVAAAPAAVASVAKVQLSAARSTPAQALLTLRSWCQFVEAGGLAIQSYNSD